MTRTVEVDQEKAVVLRRIFELYATGEYSLSTLRHKLILESDAQLARSYLETVLRNRFYLGNFVWQGIGYEGKQEPLVSPDLFQRVHDVLAGRNKPKYRKHNFAFAGLLTCAHDGCTVTSELQKGKYIYYRCSHGRGKCDLPYMREADVSNQLGELLKGIYVPETVATSIVESLRASNGRVEQERHEQLAATEQRLAMLRTRMDRLYEDKLDGKIDEAFWARKMAGYREQEYVLEAAHSGLNRPLSADHVLTVERTFELAQKAHFLYLTRSDAERGQLLKKVLLNCSTDGVTYWPTHRKPFDLIFERAKTEEWSGREDLNLRPPGPEKVVVLNESHGVALRPSCIPRVRVGQLSPVRKRGRKRMSEMMKARWAARNKTSKA